MRTVLFSSPHRLFFLSALSLLQRGDRALRSNAAFSAEGRGTRRAQGADRRAFETETKTCGSDRPVKKRQVAAPMTSTTTAAAGASADFGLFSSLAPRWHLMRAHLGRRGERRALSKVLKGDRRKRLARRRRRQRRRTDLSLSLSLSLPNKRAPCRPRTPSRNRELLPRKHARRRAMTILGRRQSDKKSMGKSRARGEGRRGQRHRLACKERERARNQNASLSAKASFRPSLSRV